MWKDKSELWIHLKEFKESHTVKVAEFSKTRGINIYPYFAWWVPYTLQKQDVILSSVKHSIRKTNHKYGIEIPYTINQDYQLDHENGVFPDPYRILISLFTC